MLTVQVDSNRISFGKEFSVSFQRTLRIPDDGKIYPLPPGLGNFPIKKVDDYRKRVPAEWLAHGGVFIPMYQREALWMCFHQPDDKPHAVKVGVGKINAISGEPWTDRLADDEQDYIVSPPQPWLDGIKAGEGFIRQFVAMPLGMGYTVEGQLTGKEEFGGIQILVAPPKADMWRTRSRFYTEHLNCDQGMIMCCSMPEMGIGAGGKMEQKVYEDEFGLSMWDQNNTGRVFVHIVNSMMYREITGEEAPSTPITAKSYVQHGLPWFSLYDETKSDLPAADPLKTVKTIKELDKEKGFDPQQDDTSLGIGKKNVKELILVDDSIRDGNW